MFIFLDDEEFDAYEEECFAIGVRLKFKKGEEPRLPYNILWLETNGVRAMSYKGQTLVSKRDKDKVLRMLRWEDFGSVLDEADTASIHLLCRMNQRFNKMIKERGGEF